MRAPIPDEVVDGGSHVEEGLPQRGREGEGDHNGAQDGNGKSGRVLGSINTGECDRIFPRSP